MIIFWFSHFSRVNKTRDIKLVKRFGKHVRSLRIANGLSQEALANEAEIPISQIGRIERGEINPTLSTISALAHALNSSLKSMMDFSD